METPASMSVHQHGSNHKEEASSAESTPPPSRVSSSSDLKEAASTAKKTLASRSKIPISMYLVAGIVVAAQSCGGVYSMEVFQSVVHSLTTSGVAAMAYCEYLRDLMKSVAMGKSSDPQEVMTAALASVCVASILYVLIYVPFRAGMWTGQRARRHKIHRYMGLSFLIMYFAAWIEFIFNYENGGRDSYLPHFVTLNGTCSVLRFPLLETCQLSSNDSHLTFLTVIMTGLVQGVSAYFSFKVLPELADPGYYSDRAVLSRTFIHENTYFGLLTFMGSCMYNEKIHSNLMAHPIGRILLLIFGYWSYVVVRPFFPTTSFSNAGSSMAGRSSRNEGFYRVGTLLVKIFYLWAKYFLGFFLNWVCCLGLGSESDRRVMRGIYLMNLGTVSISVFLHTLRFKKQLPPILAFSIYLGQIYGTFLALPYCYDLFFGHKRLLSLAIAGIVINMSRKRAFHAVWCAVCMFLLEFSDIEW